jgi:hypothetical protein
MKRRAGRPGRLQRLAERVVLGVVFSVAVAVLDRRLRKALGKSGRKPSRRRTANIS